MRIYVATSWKHPKQPEIVKELRAYGFEVYDFRNPGPGDTGFSWESIDPEWRNWKPEELEHALLSNVAHDGYMNDAAALYGADALVLLLPSGRSAHIEAGMALGRSIPVYCLAETIGSCEAELMYLPFVTITSSRTQLYEDLLAQRKSNPEQWRTA